MIGVLSVPLSGTTLEIVKYIDGGINILHHLEVEHAHTDEVSSLFKGPVKSILGLNGPGCKHFEAHHRNSGAGRLDGYYVTY